MLFAAEWGDASQIATAGLVARHRGVAHAIATGVGAWVALVAVAALAVVAGKLVVKRVPLHLVHRVAGVLFAVFAVLAAVAAIRELNNLSSDQRRTAAQICAVVTDDRCGHLPTGAGRRTLTA